MHKVFLPNAFCSTLTIFHIHFPVFPVFPALSSSRFCVGFSPHLRFFFIASAAAVAKNAIKVSAATSMKNGQHNWQKSRSHWGKIEAIEELTFWSPIKPKTKTKKKYDKKKRIKYSAHKWKTSTEHYRSDPNFGCRPWGCNTCNSCRSVALFYMPNQLQQQRQQQQQHKTDNNRSDWTCF